MEFTGDDNINWCNHARSQSKKVTPFEDIRAFDYFRFLIPENSVALDLGCNIAAWAKLFTKNNWKYIGYDASPQALKLGREIQGNDPDMQFVFGKLENVELAFPEHTFNLVFTNTVLQHMHNKNKEKAIKGIYKILDPMGYLVIQEVVDETNCRAFSFDGWIEYIEQFGFKFIKANKQVNGFVFQKICCK